MPTNQAAPSVNGDECSWADIGITLNVPGGQTLDIFDIEAIKFASKLDTGESRGTSGGRVMKETAGSESSEASATFTKSGLAVLLAALEVAARAINAVRGNEVIISAVRFDVLIQHTPLGSTDIYETKLTGCRYKGDSHDNKQGNEATTVEVTLNPIKILRKSQTTGDWLVLR